MLSYHADFVMADPAQLRKCEELLGKLPEKPPAAQARNPMWAFLKGIEGFDTERACECLVKLLDKHYDTIGVLKLATKRDLVEDAAILPGDALRIVAAAKHYEPAGDPPPQMDASEPGVVGDADQLQSVTHHQHAYRPPALREKTVTSNPSVMTPESSPHVYSPPVMLEQKKAKTVAQESWKREEQENPAAPSANEVKIVNQGAIPKQEAAKESKAVKQAPPKHIKDVISHVKDSKVQEQTHLIPVGITYPHTCRICNIQCVSEINCRMHYNGRIHRAKFAEVLESVKEAKQPAQAPEAVKETKKPAESQEEKQPTQSVPLQTCGVCNVKCTSEVDLRSHFNGRIHIQKMEAATDSNDNSPTTFLHCSICDINSTCKRNLVMHFNGKKHAQNMKNWGTGKDHLHHGWSHSHQFLCKVFRVLQGWFNRITFREYRGTGESGIKNGRCYSAGMSKCSPLSKT